VELEIRLKITPKQGLFFIANTLIIAQNALFVNIATLCYNTFCCNNLQVLFRRYEMSSSNFTSNELSVALTLENGSEADMYLANFLTRMTSDCDKPGTFWFYVKKTKLNDVDFRMNLLALRAEYNTKLYEYHKNGAYSALKDCIGKLATVKQYIEKRLSLEEARYDKKLYKERIRQAEQKIAELIDEIDQMPRTWED
jgi:hypothetical protein